MKAREKTIVRNSRIVGYYGEVRDWHNKVIARTTEIYPLRHLANAAAHRLLETLKQGPKVRP